MSRAAARHAQLSATARRAVQSADWATVDACARQILQQDGNSAEGHFLAGLAARAAGLILNAEQAFARAVSADSARYDAAIELASLYAASLRHREAMELLQRYESRLFNSPLYLDMAASTWTRLGLHARAWPLFCKANELQPDIDRFQANMAACAVYLGKIAEAQGLYRALLQRQPDHQRHHFELARLARARDAAHVEQMQDILRRKQLPAEKNIFLYYAIGKELEDLERWQEAFDYYRLAGDTVTALADYDVGTDIALIDQVIASCSASWLAENCALQPAAMVGAVPIFIVGLPRTGTTLTERIIASHSQVESADETFFLPIALRRVSGVDSGPSVTPAVVRAAAHKDAGLIAKAYLDAVAYRLGGKPMFIDKLPENFLYLGFIAKAFPQARIVHLRRNPMDACFAMYKQSYFKFAYTLENVGRYYVAYERLRRHWASVLPGRMIEVQYESLVAEPEGQTRMLLQKLGLPFEPACLNFDRNETPSATASSVQVRERVHDRSVNRWRHFSSQLQTLKAFLEQAGIEIDDRD